MRSRAIERLLRLAQVKYAASRSPLGPWNQGGPKLRVSSPVPGRSTLMTSAPRSARSWVAQGPASTRLTSTTRMPLKARGTAEDSVTSTVSCIERRVFSIITRGVMSAAHDPMTTARYLGRRNEPYAARLSSSEVCRMGREFDWEDPFRLSDQLTDTEQMVRDSARSYRQSALLPRVRDAARHERFDREILSEMGSLGLLGRRCRKTMADRIWDTWPMA